MNGRKLKIQFLKRSLLSNIQHENCKRNTGTCFCLLGIDLFSYHISYHFYSVHALLADPRTKRPGYFYKDRQALDERLVESCWLSYKSKRQRKFYSWQNIYRYLQS